MNADPDRESRLLTRNMPQVTDKLIDINKEIDGEGKTFRLGEKVYFVRELG